MHNLHPSLYLVDCCALVTLLGSLAGYLPLIAAGMAAIWYAIAIIDALARWLRYGPGNK